MKHLFAIHPPLTLFFLSSSTTVLYSWLFLPLAILFLLDVVGRVRDWIVLKNKPPEYFTLRLMSYYGTSWCGRTLIKAAYPKAKYYYKALGYKWYHFFPDNILQKIRNPKFYIQLVKGH